MKRPALSKRLRFEIFKRDGFRCLYCGATPVTSPLHVDHVKSVKAGGDSSPANLVTACADCNLGKSAVPLDRKALRSNIASDAEKDHAKQILEYLALQREIQRAREKVIDALADWWQGELGPMTQEQYDHLGGLVKRWPIDALHEAIEITRRKFGTTEEFDADSAVRQSKYFYGILRKWTEQLEEQET